MIKLCEIVEQLLDYIEANLGICDKPVTLFSNFVDAIYNGTFNREHLDPSGLCWLPPNVATINPKLQLLENFSDWMEKNGYVANCLNPWTNATSTEARFNWIAWYRKNENSFLGHLGRSQTQTAEMKQARVVKLRRRPAGKTSAPKSFPKNMEALFLQHGFIRHGKQNHPDIIEKYDWRGICISLLLLYGSRRVSEPFHLWTGDVMDDPTRPGTALVRIYHPSEGQAPSFPKFRGRRVQNRKTYLQLFYPKYSTRDIGTGKYHAGFKGRAFSDDTAKYIQVHWLPTQMGEAFLFAYHNYMQFRARYKLDSLQHPFAFVSHRAEARGEPYTIDTFTNVWARALRRIGLPHGKVHGTSTHGGRHAGGARANEAEIDELSVQEMFAHRSPKSQQVYRVPTINEVTKKMDEASRKIESKDRFGTDVCNDLRQDFNWKNFW